MKLISWNVNGLRACVGKGFEDFFSASGADMFCLQETKLQVGQISLELNGYTQYFNSAQKKGYSGTALMTRVKPDAVKFGIYDGEPDEEGRVITASYPSFFLVNVYTPNSQRGLTRIDFRMEWEDSFREYLMTLDRVKPVIVCGDMNVARTEIDLKNPRSNVGNAGFTPQEREKMELLLSSGFTDSFRHLYPDRRDAYTWWSYMYNARANNAGWRIDYFLVSNRLAPAIRGAEIYSQIMGSDHCPVGLDIDL